jgi:hypothetical protein
MRKRTVDPRAQATTSATQIIMRASLHHHAPNTYYGQWLYVFAKE